MSGAGRAWPLRGLLAGESSAAGFFQSENLFGRHRERRRSSRMLLTPSSASAPAAGSGTIVGMTATNASVLPLRMPEPTIVLPSALMPG